MDDNQGEDAATHTKGYQSPRGDNEKNRRPAKTTESIFIPRKVADGLRDVHERTRQSALIARFPPITYATTRIHDQRRENLAGFEDQGHSLRPASVLPTSASEYGIP